ncbi:MAG: pantoate--beta-alanine ligase, partial [Candidatus Omnitrophota bacterium]
FVNPAQFAPNEDFKKYPRDLLRDAGLCRRQGADIIFCPSPAEMYPRGYKTFVEVEDLSSLLCGSSRPGHFRGVATVVTKLINIVCPDIVYLGQKDAQQVVIIRKMVRDLNLPVSIKAMPTVREKDGLALSSRNAYLDERERVDAVALSQSLKLAKDLIRCGIRDSAVVIKRMWYLLQQNKSVKVDYISIVDRESLKPVSRIKGACLVALAVYIGRVRLIDNAILRIPM